MGSLYNESDYRNALESAKNLLKISETPYIIMEYNHVSNCERFMELGMIPVYFFKGDKTPSNSLKLISYVF